MVKKAIHHFNRGLVIGLEIIGVFGILAVLLWVGLLIRLSQGPLNADFLTEKLENELNSRQVGFVFDVGRTELSWGGRLEPFELQMYDVQVLRADKTPVFAVGNVGVQLSKRRLVFGQLVPKVVRIHEPAVRIIRWEDGHFTLNLGTLPGEGVQEKQSEDLESRTELFKALLLQLQDRSLAFIGGLREIHIDDAAVFYEDKILQVDWKSHESNIVFARGKKGLVAQTDISLNLSESHKTFIRANVTYDWETEKTAAIMVFNDFIPALAAQESPQLQKLIGVHLPLKGSVAVELGPSFKAERARFILDSDAGTLNALDLYTAPVPVSRLYLNGSFNFNTGAADITRAHFALEGGSAVEARLKITPEDLAHKIQAEAVLKNMAIDKLKVFWPDTLAVSAREWVMEHLSKGIASKSTLDIGMTVAHDGKIRDVKLDHLGGRIDFNNITVDYFPPLQRVTGASGFATYDAKSFNLDIKSGKLKDMDVTKSAIHISGLDQSDKHANIDIDVSLTGPLKTALGVLDSKPLEYPKSMGLRTDDVGGMADVDVNFKFPLHTDLELEEVKVTADAVVKEVLLQDVAFDSALTGGPMDVHFSDSTLKVKGSGRLGGMPLTFDWAKYFIDKTLDTKVAAKIDLDQVALRSFDLPEDIRIEGHIPADIVHNTYKDKTAQLDFKGDIGQAALEVPAIGYKKAAGVTGDLNFNMRLKNNKPQDISSFHLTSAGMLLQGNIHFENDTLKQANFPRVVLDDTDVSLTVRRDHAGAYRVDAKGRQVDVSSLIKDDGGRKPSDKDAGPIKKSIPLLLSMEVDRLITGEDKSIENVKVFLHRDIWQRIAQLEMDGTAGKGAIYVRFLPAEDQEGYTLQFEADDAGAALRALGVTSSIRGGKMTVNGSKAEQNGDRDLAGTLILTDFAVRDVPALGKLFNALSLTGMIDLLNNRGVSFRKLRSKFIWTDRSPPTYEGNIRRIRFKKGQTSGSSLGLTFEGDIDRWNGIYDLNGTIVPVSDVNKLISVIPIIGDVLTAGGEGIFAATYTIKGPREKPEVKVNPLAALAPGVLRKMFFD